jgi:4-hydroxy-3-methylbut-2-enyl diphosphate reductase
VSDLLVVAALRSEFAALAGQVGDARLERCGMGPARVRAWLPDALASRPDAVVVAGVAGGLDPSLRPGDIVVASEVRGPHRRTVLRSGAPLVAELRRLGLRVRSGPMLSRETLIGGADEREQLAETGALAADMESADIAAAFTDQHIPVAVVRVIVDTATVPLMRPATVYAGV